jgi:hypothetical protein
MRKSLVILVFACIALTCEGQEAGIILLKGKVVSASTGEAIGFATIALARNGIATMSNEDGAFVFKIPAEASRDSIFISHIGYQSLAIIVNDADTGIQTIALKEKSVELPGVTVTHLNPLALIQKAITRIPDNYPSKPYVSYGFYRFAGWNSGKIVDLAEAVFDIYSPDDDREHKQFRLIKVRADMDEAVLSGTHLVLGRQPAGLMSDDLVSRIHEAPVIGDEEIDKLDFTYNGLIDDEGRPCYEILFDQKDGLQEAFHKGRILIDCRSMAFVLFDYSLSPKGADSWRPRQPAAPTPQGQTMNITYRKYGGKYYLSHVSRDAKWTYESIPGLALDNKSIYLVTRIDTSVAHKPEGKLIDNKQAIETNAKKNSSRADSFWENYNLVEAEFNVDSTLKAIRH